MDIGAHDSMITITNGGNAIDGATLVIHSLVPCMVPFGRINKYHVNVNCTI